jgi:hypothetical protein
VKAARQHAEDRGRYDEHPNLGHDIFNTQIRQSVFQLAELLTHFLSEFLELCLDLLSEVIHISSEVLDLSFRLDPKVSNVSIHLVRFDSHVSDFRFEGGQPLAHWVFG